MEAMDGVKTIMESHTIITHKLAGDSNREVARKTGFNRKTVARYWNEYQHNLKALDGCDDIRVAQEAIIAKPQYNTSSRHPVKYTDEMDAALDAILAAEEQKRKTLGSRNKQMKTVRQMHRELKDSGFDIGLTTITSKVAEKRARRREAFIRQEYEFGDRLEYDFGEVCLEIAGISGTYHMAAIASPAGRFRWAYLYADQKKDSFLDSHVRFFAMVGGVWRRMVYDNMKNVVTRFIGRSEKELNSDLVALSRYYGFIPDTTNCYAGNEKGYVEGSVKIIRREVFAKRYSFDSFDEAAEYLQQELVRINADSAIEEEKAHLAPTRPPLDLADVSTPKVNKYSFVQVANNSYSVPEYMVGHVVTAKCYVFEVLIYAGTSLIAKHSRLRGAGQMSVDIMHYLGTLARKPGAVASSKALKCQDRLKALFDEQFSERPKDFIALLKANAHLPIDGLVAAVAKGAECMPAFAPVASPSLSKSIENASRAQLEAISQALLRGGEKVA
jgi:transposase